MKRLFLLTAMAASLSAAAQVWDKTFPQSDQVSVEKVSFKNRYDITVVADMYLPKNLNRSQEHAAIVIGHPFGGVKEQSSGLYAQQLAERGFVTLAFDLSYGGESGGTPRHLASPETYVDDFQRRRRFCRKATVRRPEPDRSHRYLRKRRIRCRRTQKYLEEIAAQRWSEVDGAPVRMLMGTPDSIDEHSPEVAKEFFDYYRTPRGQHPRCTTGITYTSSAPMMNFFPIRRISN